MRSSGDERPKHAAFLVSLFALAATSCASSLDGMKSESRSVARQLGVPKCRASVPLTPSEVVEEARKGGNPHPEEHGDWIKITASLRPGDQLREINCLGAGDSLFYALIRNDEIVLRFYPVIFD
jgi:hypothetical protein